MSKNILQKLASLQEGIFIPQDAPAFLHAVLKSIQEGVMLISLEGTILSINRAAIQLLEINPQLNTPFWESFNDEFFGFSMKDALFFGLFREKSYRSFGSKEFEISCSYFFQGPKISHGLLVIIKDQTKEKELKAKLEHSKRLQKLGEMVASISHEIRNPLGGIRGYASLLLRDLWRESHLQEMAKSIIDGTKSLERLVSSILQYAKPVELNLKSVELTQFLRQFTKFIKTDPGKPQLVNIETHFPEDPIVAPIDKETLNMSLLNLVFNAYQAMPHGGNLQISLLKIDSCYQIAVSDTGVGMNEENMAQVFSPFFTTKKEGNGIGLSEVQKIVKAHNGSIDVRSSLGKGTTFTLTFPLQRF